MIFIINFLFIYLFTFRMYSPVDKNILNAIIKVGSGRLGKKNIVWNDYISQNERFADFFNGVVFHGHQVVLSEDLTPLDSKLWRREQEKNSYNEYIRDTVKLWKHRDKKYILSLEPEESPHYALPVKYMNYESVQYDRQYKESMKAHRKSRDLCPDE